MSQKISPFIEVKWGWNFGESGWNTGVDENLIKFSFLFDRNVDAIVPVLPENPSNGQAFFLTSDNRLYFRLDSNWYSSPTPKWFEFQIRATGELYQFNGSTLVSIESSSELSDRIEDVEITLSTLGGAAFQNVEYFATQASLDVVEASLSSDIETVSEGIIATEERFEQELSAAGYTSLGSYAAGLNVVSLKEYFKRDGRFYSTKESATLPYSTTGDWATDSANLVLLGDDVLRQDLANPDKGAAMVASASVSVPSLEEMASLSTSRRNIAFLDMPGRSGVFSYRSGDVSELVSADVYSGVVVPSDEDPTGLQGAWFRQFEDGLNLSWFGVTLNDPSKEADNAARLVSAEHVCHLLGAHLIIPPGEVAVVSQDGFTFRCSIRGSASTKGKSILTIRGSGIFLQSMDTYIRDLLIQSDAFAENGGAITEGDIDSNSFGVKMRGYSTVTGTTVSGFGTGYWFYERMQNRVDQSTVSYCMDDVVFGGGSWCNDNSISNSQIQHSFGRGVHALVGVNTVENCNIENHFNSNDPNEAPEKGSIVVEQDAELLMTGGWLEDGRICNRGTFLTTDVFVNGIGAVKFIQEAGRTNFSSRRQAQPVQNLVPFDWVGHDASLTDWAVSGADVYGTGSQVDPSTGERYIRVVLNSASGFAEIMLPRFDINPERLFTRPTEYTLGQFFLLRYKLVDPLSVMSVAARVDGDGWGQSLSFSRTTRFQTEVGKWHSIGGLEELRIDTSTQPSGIRRLRLRLGLGDGVTDYSSSPVEVWLSGAVLQVWGAPVGTPLNRSIFG